MYSKEKDLNLYSKERQPHFLVEDLFTYLNGPKTIWKSFYVSSLIRKNSLNVWLSEPTGFTLAWQSSAQVVLSFIYFNPILK